MKHFTKITLSLYSCWTAEAAAASRRASAPLCFSLWEEDVTSHYVLTSDRILMSPANIHTRRNMTKTAKSMGYIQDISPIQRGGLIWIIYSFWMWPAVFAATHHTGFSLSSHRRCSQPMGPSEIVQNKLPLSHYLYIQCALENSNSMWSFSKFFCWGEYYFPRNSKLCKKCEMEENSESNTQTRFHVSPSHAVGRMDY